jgi:hypothetical protein
MMLRLPLPCSPVIFLSIDYERYMTLLVLRQGIGSRIVGEILRGEEANTCSKNMYSTICFNGFSKLGFETNA